MNKMNRLERLNVLKQLEEQKQNNENALTDIKNSYFESGKITFELKTSLYNKKYNGEWIGFNPDLMIGYLEKEIHRLEMLIEFHIDQLITKGNKNELSDL